MWPSIANDGGIYLFANNFQKSWCCNYCSEDKQFLSEHKCKAWQNLLLDCITKYRIVLTTKLVATIYVTFSNTVNRDEVTGEWRRLHKEELYDLY